jgi:hypothetical protein
MWPSLCVVLGAEGCVEGGGVLLLLFASHQPTVPPHARSAAHSPCAAGVWR